MATIINTGDESQLAALDDFQDHQAYNALDCMVTAEVWRKRLGHFDEMTWMTYLQEKDIQAPALEMQLRGIEVDAATVESEVNTLTSEINILQDYFARLAHAAYGQHVNWKSASQLKKMLNDLGFKCDGTERDTLEKLKLHFYAEPIINAILALRDRDKLRSNLQNSRRERTGRWHAQFRVAGTVTGRLSSSKDPFGEGWNLQNINDRTRRVFTCPPGWKLAYVDLEQAESRAVAYLAGDTAYIQACESGDLHTLVTKMTWQELGWTGDLAQDKAIAEQPFYRGIGYRLYGKTLGHGTNYYGKPATMAKHSKVPVEVVRDFQERYLAQFPGIQEWWYRIMHDLMTDGWLMTPFGRYRRFFGRPDDDKTIRKAIAFEPQSLVSDILNTGLWRLWQEPGIIPLAQVHDAVLFMFPEDEEPSIIPRAKEILEIPISVNGRTLLIPAEPNTGWNWGKYDESKNPGGIKKWSGADDRERPARSNLIDALC